MTDTATTAAAATPAAEEATDLAALAELTAQRSAVVPPARPLVPRGGGRGVSGRAEGHALPRRHGNTPWTPATAPSPPTCPAADAHAITDLAVDYVRAFIGHGVDAYSAAYPFESVYTSQAPRDAGGPRRGAGGLPQRGPGQAAQLEGVRGSHRARSWSSWPCSATAS